MQPLRIHPEVLEALANHTPVVALESAVITHGLPRTPTILPEELKIEGWRNDQPTNLELARAMSSIVRTHDAVPAMVAVIDGTLQIGLDDEELISLAERKSPAKAAIHNLAMILATGQTAGTTVSATLTACALSHQSKIQNPKSKISVFATGGIGGVHRNWQQTPDISADLRALASTPVCVVCSGAKSILDLPATIEALETLGVPVIGYRTDRFPQFQCAASESLRLTQRADDVETIAQTCDLHWNSLNRSTGILLAQPVPSQFALNSSEYEAIVKDAESSATSQGISGAARTPYLLNEIARRTNGRSLHANLALLIENAKLAAQLAVAMAVRDAGENRLTR